ncbi:hypothetical protein PGT21_007178 [Puccinia graminis f. sp. tritici]|uniref:Uncharacterized protein n=1 Tax=Puccinia graminis f. sp. tritici TaxID=56615 RepID=A0A5B0NFR9_PUCGR|nr:hypothetical protein PGT21_007178 [Puccinia graminis f. sp. tritici]
MVALTDSSERDQSPEPRWPSLPCLAGMHQYDTEQNAWLSSSWPTRCPEEGSRQTRLAERVGCIPLLLINTDRAG